MASLLLGVVAVLLGSAACFFSVWAVLPAFRYKFWLMAVVAGEQGLWMGLAGLIAFGCGVASGLWWAIAGGILGAMAFALSLVPTAQAWQTAAREKVTLSLRDYFSGNPAGRSAHPPETVAFAYPNGPDAAPLLLDIYRSTKSQHPTPNTSFPCLVVVHGGSWKAGDKSDFARWDRYFASQGFVVFDVQYRLEPAPNFRAATDDVISALAWVHEHACEWGADSAHVAVLGRSAGGHLALLSAYTAPIPLRPRAVVALYAPTELVWGYHNTYRWDVIGGKDILSRFLGGTPDTVTDTYYAAEPGRYICHDSPPTLLFHGTRDTLVGAHHSRELAARLTAAKVRHRAVYLPWSHHGFDYFFHGWGAQTVRPILRDFLQTHFYADTMPPLTKPQDSHALNHQS